MGEVIQFNGNTRLDLDPDQVLEKNKGSFQSLLIVGFDHDGNFIAASTTSDGGDLLWMVEKFRAKLLNGDYSE